MTHQIVAHDESHLMINCPNCEDPLCAHYPGDRDAGEACSSTYYGSGTSHVCQGRDK